MIPHDLIKLFIPSWGYGDAVHDMQLRLEKKHRIKHLPARADHYFRIA